MKLAPCADVTSLQCALAPAQGVRSASFWFECPWASAPRIDIDDAERIALLENTRAELRLHLARLRVVREQIQEIGHERLR